jgi:hypothetical protein
MHTHTDTTTSYIQACLGPRTPGGVYFNATTQRTYQVEAIYHGNHARQALGGTPADWAIAIRDIDDNLDDNLDDDNPADNPQMERTAWDPTRDYIICDPAR